MGMGGEVMCARVAAAVGVSLGEIDPDLRPASQMREHLDTEAIGDYACKLASLPPVKLRFDREAGLHWVVDGAHTISAAIRAGVPEVAAIVEVGTYEDAWHAAARENETHGVPIKTGDRHARLIRARELFPGRSLRWYADMCNVSHQTACNVLGALSNVDNAGGAETTKTVACRDGRRYPAKKKPSQPRPAKPPFVCPQCGDEFAAAVSHCHECGGHFAATENVCPECWRPDEVVENEGLAPDPAPTSLPGQRDLPLEEKVDYDAWWAEEEAAIMRRYDAWPEAARATFVVELLFLAERLERRHPEIVDRSDVTL